MSALQTLKTFIHQKLAGAVDEILGLVETTVQNYEEEIEQQKKIIETERTQNMLRSNDTESPQAMRFRVIIDEDVKKITFANGLPFCMNDFTQVVKHAFSIEDNIRLHYKDSDFDDFFTLSSTRDLKDKDTIKVVHVSNNAKNTSTTATTPTQNVMPILPEMNCFNDIPAIELPDLPSIEETLQLNSKEQMDLNLDLQDCASVASEDAVPLNILNSNEPQDRPNGDSSSTFRKLWPTVFEIPTFSYSTEVVLRKANDKFLKDGSLIVPDELKSVKSDILERLAEAMFMYTAYPNDLQRKIVCQALIKKHPYLRESGSPSGLEGWFNSMRYKISNYRTKLRNRGTQELVLNSLKHKPDERRCPALVKKPRKSEVNYLPPFPVGETASSLENLRLRLVELHQSRAAAQVNELMDRTYSYRRQEVVFKSLKVEEIQERWPALFTPEQINKEFERCTTIPLQSSFTSNLDKYTPKLLTLFSAVGGTLGQRLRSQWLELVQDPCASAPKKRDVILRCLIEYMGDRVTDLVSDFCGVPEEEALEEVKRDSLKVYVCSQPDAVGVVVDGAPVLRGLDSLSSACCLLFGLLYALNKDFPSPLFKTLELFQKLLVGLDSVPVRYSSKLVNLKNKLMTMN